METLKPIFSPPSFKPSMQMNQFVFCFNRISLPAMFGIPFHSLPLIWCSYEQCSLNTFRIYSMIAIPCIGKYRGSECFLSVAFHLTTTKVAHVRLLAIVRGPIDTILTSMLSAPLLRNIMSLYGWYEVCNCNGRAVQWYKANHIEIFSLLLTISLSLSTWISMCEFKPETQQKPFDFHPHHRAISIIMCLPLWHFQKQYFWRIHFQTIHFPAMHFEKIPLWREKKLPNSITRVTPVKSLLGILIHQSHQYSRRNKTHSVNK